MPSRCCGAAGTPAAARSPSSRTTHMAKMMIGDTTIRARAERKPTTGKQPVVLDIAGLFAEDDEGLPGARRA